jgi:hypothetical protein
MPSTPTSLMPRLLEFRPFAERLGVDPDVLRQDHECPSVVVIGGVEHAVLDELARFEVSLLLRAWGEECEAHRNRRAASRRSRSAAAGASENATAVSERETAFA